MRTGRLFFVVLFLLQMCSYGFAYDSEKVHPAINKNAAYQSTVGFHLKQLGFSQGLEKTFNKIEVWEWLRQGGTEEDSWPRPLNHFHDPLKEWGSAGIFPGESALRFAQDTEGNLYGWQKARAYYYAALASGKEEYFVQTFKSLGQVMHLVADMAVPAHVRGDLHPTFIPWEAEPYERWAADNFQTLNFSGTISGPSRIFDNAVYDFRTPVPISALWCRLSN